MAKNFREYESRVDSYRCRQYQNRPDSPFEALCRGAGIFLGYLALVALGFAFFGVLVIVFAS